MKIPLEVQYFLPEAARKELAGRLGLSRGGSTFRVQDVYFDNACYPLPLGCSVRMRRVGRHKAWRKHFTFRPDDFAGGGLEIRLDREYEGAAGPTLEQPALELPDAARRLGDPAAVGELLASHGVEDAQPAGQALLPALGIQFQRTEYPVPGGSVCFDGPIAYYGFDKDDARRVDRHDRVFVVEVKVPYGDEHRRIVDALVEASAFPAIPKPYFAYTRTRRTDAMRERRAKLRKDLIQGTEHEAKLELGGDVARACWRIREACLANDLGVSLYGEYPFADRTSAIVWYHVIGEDEIKSMFRTGRHKFVYKHDQVVDEAGLEREERKDRYDQLSKPSHFRALRQKLAEHAVLGRILKNRLAIYVEVDGWGYHITLDRCSRIDPETGLLDGEVLQQIEIEYHRTRKDTKTRGDPDEIVRRHIHLITELVRAAGVDAVPSTRKKADFSCGA